MFGFPCSVCVFGFLFRFSVFDFPIPAFYFRCFVAGFPISVIGFSSCLFVKHEGGANTPLRSSLLLPNCLFFARLLARFGCFPTLVIMAVTTTSALLSLVLVEPSRLSFFFTVCFLHML